MTPRKNRHLTHFALLAAALLIVALPASSASARKHRKGLAMSSVSKKGSSSVRPPTTIAVNVGIANPSRRRARPQPLTVNLGSVASTSTFTPGIRRRSSTAFQVALSLAAGIPTAKYTLQACLGGKVFRGASRCASSRKTVHVLSTKVNLAISPTSKAFGDVVVATDSPQQAFTITNQSLVQSTTPSVALSGVGFQLASNGCTTPISPGGACSVAVLFHPTAPGSQSGNVKVTASGDTATATLTGNGV